MSDETKNVFKALGKLVGICFTAISLLIMAHQAGLINLGRTDSPTVSGPTVTGLSTSESSSESSYLLESQGTHQPVPSLTSDAPSSSIPEQQRHSLENATNIGNRLYEYNNLEDNYGNKYLVSYSIRQIYSTFTYETLLDSKYSFFTGTFFVKNGSTYDDICQLKIILDGVTIFIEELSKTSRPIYIEDLNIADGNVFQITTSYAGYPLEVYVTDAWFLP